MPVKSKGIPDISHVPWIVEMWNKRVAEHVENKYKLHKDGAPIPKDFEISVKNTALLIQSLRERTYGGIAEDLVYLYSHRFKSAQHSYRGPIAIHYCEVGVPFNLWKEVKLLYVDNTASSDSGSYQLPYTPEEWAFFEEYRPSKCIDGFPVFKAPDAIYWFYPVI